MFFPEADTRGIVKRSSVTRIDRDHLVRCRMIELHGTRGLFSRAVHHSLDGRQHAVQVGHLLALKHGAPDVLQNVMPMSAIVNRLWDERVRARAKTADPSLVVGGDFDPYGRADIGTIVDNWVPLASMLNNLNRAMGHPDAYPFILTPVVIEKLGFVHGLVGR